MRNLSDSQVGRHETLASTDERKPGRRSTPRSQSTAGRKIEGIDPERFYCFDDFCDALALSDDVRGLLLASLREENLKYEKVKHQFIELESRYRVVMGGAGLRNLWFMRDQARESRAPMA